MKPRKSGIVLHTLPEHKGETIIAHMDTKTTKRGIRWLKEISSRIKIIDRRP